jgi:hypothetical protein
MLVKTSEMFGPSHHLDRPCHGKISTQKKDGKIKYFTASNVFILGYDYL